MEGADLVWKVGVAGNDLEFKVVGFVVGDRRRRIGRPRSERRGKAGGDLGDFEGSEGCSGGVLVEVL